MTPTETDTGFYNSSLCGEPCIWSKNKKLGYVFDSNAGFTLPNGSVHYPDASWISKVRYWSLDKSERSLFASICQDFVAEIRSEFDNLENLKRKMTEYIHNDCRLGWLINPVDEKAYVYHIDGSVTIIDSFNLILSGDDVLVGFELDLNIFKQ
jgi:Uma2 family endonuclease